MKYFLLTFLVVSTNASFLARVRNHWEEKTKRPECHIEFEDVTEPHCETITEQVCWEELKNQCKTEYTTSCETEYNTKCKTEYEELCEIVEKEQCHTEHEEQCHDEFVEECKTEYTEECQDEPEEKCQTETSQECTTAFDEVCSIDYAESCHPEWVEKCKEVPDCRTECQEECNVKEDAKPKFTKWKRHAVDEMETADVEEESLEGRQKRSLATAAAVFGAGAVKATVVGAAAGAAIGGVVLPGAIGYGLGRKVGAGAKKLVQIKSDLVQRKRERFGRSVDELAEEEIVDMGRLKELSEGAEEERGTAAETHDTWSSWACRCTGRRCCWCCTSCCCTSGCCRWCWTSGGRSLRQETWLQGWSSPCSQGKGCQAGPRQEAPSKSQARPRLQTSPS